MSNGGFVGKIKETLVELVVRNLIDVGNKKPRSRKARSSKRNNRTVTRHKSSIAFIVTNVITNSLKASVEIDKHEDTLEHTAEEETEDMEEEVVHGGYGTTKPYAGMSPHIKYTDYNKIWSHLGAFRTNNAYGNVERAPNQIAMDNGESSREMVSYETINKAEKHFKYFIIGELMGEVGLVPPVGIGIDSRDWEKYRLMTFMSIYRPLLKLMRSMA